MQEQAVKRPVELPTGLSGTAGAKPTSLFLSRGAKAVNTFRSTPKLQSQLEAEVETSQTLKDSAKLC